MAYDMGIYSVLVNEVALCCLTWQYSSLSLQKFELSLISFNARWNSTY